jgi:hypothetical protein
MNASFLTRKLPESLIPNASVLSRSLTPTLMVLLPYNALFTSLIVSRFARFDPTSATSNLAYFQGECSVVYRHYFRSYLIICLDWLKEPLLTLYFSFSRLILKDHNIHLLPDSLL